MLPAMAAALFVGAVFAKPVRNVVDEVVWVVGDEAIFRSDVEEMYQQMRSDGEVMSGDPYCFIPERIAVEKLYLHQAKIDTIEANEGQVQAGVDQRINFFVENLGSKEKVEEYFRKPLPQLRNQLLEIMRNNYIVESVQQNLTKDVKATPNEVRKYFTSLSQDSVPYVPMQVETQIITLNPVIPRQEIEDVKARLRDYADRVNKGESSFSSLAILFSEDGSASHGGELGFHGRAEWVPEFANVAFNLTDPKKVSKIVETEFGYHIIQLIAKRGDMVNVRHILLTPKVSQKDLAAATSRLDSIRKEIVAGKFTFEMQPGDVSEPFVMRDGKTGKEVAAIVRLTSRIPGHKANLSDDYSLIKDMYENYARENVIRDWVEKKIKDTYVRIEDGWGECDFKYKGWVK